MSGRGSVRRRTSRKSTSRRGTVRRNKYKTAKRWLKRAAAMAAIAAVMYVTTRPTETKATAKAKAKATAKSIVENKKGAPLTKTEKKEVSKEVDKQFKFNRPSRFNPPNIYDHEVLESRGLMIGGIPTTQRKSKKKPTTRRGTRVRKQAKPRSA